MSANAFRKTTCLDIIYEIVIERLIYVFIVDDSFENLCKENAVIWYLCIFMFSPQEINVYDAILHPCCVGLSFLYRKIWYSFSKILDSLTAWLGEKRKTEFSAELQSFRPWVNLGFFSRTTLSYGIWCINPHLYYTWIERIIWADWPTCYMVLTEACKICYRKWFDRNWILLH